MIRDSWMGLERPSNSIRPRLFALSLPAAVLALAAFVGCGGTKTSDRDVEFVDVTAAADLAEGSNGVLGMGDRRTAWIDPRPASRFATEHIPGAINLSPTDLLKDDERLKSYNVFIVYGDDYDPTLATVMTKNLIRMGYDDVRALRGGLRAWKQAGNETEGEASAGETGDAE